MSYLNGDGDAPVPGAELKKLGQEVGSAIATLKDAVDSKNKETLDKVTKFFDQYEEKSSAFTKEWAAHQKQTREQAEKLEAAEKALAEAKKGTEDYQKKYEHLELLVASAGKKAEQETEASRRENDAEYKAFMHSISHGNCAEFKAIQTAGGMVAAKWNPQGLDFKVLRTDSESAGGYLIPQVMDNVIRKNIIEKSPVRLHARVRTSPGKTMDIPRRLSVPLAQFEGEAEDSPTDQSIYGSEQVTCYRQTVTIPATLDMMVSSAFDLEREIASDVGESFAQGEGLNFVKGNGRKSPQGFVVDARVVGYTSGTSANFTFDDLAKMAGALKRGQQPWWYMNRKTVAYIQALKSSINVPIWMPVAGNQPATIWGYPYDSNMIDMDDVSTGSGAKPIAFADLGRGYEIYDMIGMNVVRDDLTQKKKAITEWTFRRYLTGRVILPEAISVMTLL